MAMHLHEHPAHARRRRIRHHIIRISKYVFLIMGIGFGMVFTLPTLFISVIQHQQTFVIEKAPVEPFPITVNPQTKTIKDDEDINTLLDGDNSPLQAAVGASNNPLIHGLQSLASLISQAPWYRNVASVAGFKSRLVEIPNGMRKEQVAAIFGKALDWDTKEREEFLTIGKGADLPFYEGTFFPGLYVVNESMTPSMVQDLVNNRFTEQVIDHYSSDASEVLPLRKALVVASIIQRETIGNEDMRLVSGIIWNRLFKDMKLQIDSTLQYAKASETATKEWWPPVASKDKYIDSPYNTYKYADLPPTPISSPSAGAIIAALNPLKTTCLFYFNDKKGDFHCSDTYAEHVKQLDKAY
jgi:UPF0755 protein